MPRRRGAKAACCARDCDVEGTMVARDEKSALSFIVVDKDSTLNEEAVMNELVFEISFRSIARRGLQ